VGGWGGGKIVIPMPEALSFAESRRQKVMTRKFALIDLLLGMLCIKFFGSEEYTAVDRLFYSTSAKIELTEN
jgi:hypothetical protein